MAGTKLRGRKTPFAGPKEPLAAPPAQPSALQGKASLTRALWLGASGAALTGITFWLYLVSHRFEYGKSAFEQPVFTLTALLMAAGLIYLGALRLIKAPRSKTALCWMLAAGLAMRLIMMPAEPMLEDDHYRYLWDGAVTCAGFSPYGHAPEQALKGGSAPPELRKLAEQARPIVERINHPWLKTIYPPIAQAAFALAHLISPFSLMAFKAVLLFFDIAALVMVFALLKSLELPPLQAMVYWWNPLLIKEVYNSGHMEPVLLAFACLGLLLACRGRSLAALAALALAAGAKVWPVLLAPFALRPLASNPARLTSALFFFGCLCLLLFWPFSLGGLTEGSGLLAYSAEWEMNDAFFLPLAWGAEQVLGALGQDPALGHKAARILVGLFIAGLSLALAWRAKAEPKRLAGGFLAVTACLYLFSPTCFPWYYLWLLPFLALTPRLSLLCLTASLPIYYLRFHFQAAGQTAFFDEGLVWLEFTPVALIFIWEEISSRKALKHAAR